MRANNYLKVSVWTNERFRESSHISTSIEPMPPRIRGVNSEPDGRACLCWVFPFDASKPESVEDAYVAANRQRVHVQRRYGYAKMSVYKPVKRYKLDLIGDFAELSRGAA